MVFGLAVLLGTTTQALAGPGDLFTEKVMDFGTSPRGTVLVHYFRFTNNTNQTLTLGNPRVSCGCVSAAVNKPQVAPGETGVVIAHMDTRRIPQPNTVKSVTVYVPFLAPVREEVSLRVQTVTRDDLILTPDKIAFGDIPAGKGGAKSTKVTFASDPSWKITEVTSTGGFVKADCKEESRNGNFVTYAVTAKVDEKCPAGNWICYLHLKTSNPATGKIRVPVTVTVTPDTSIKTESAAFGTLPVGVETEKTITIQSQKPFKILEVKGADEELKVVLPKAEARQKHTIILAAHPQSTGGFTRTVEIVTDSKDQPKLVIPVTAKVVEK